MIAKHWPEDQKLGSEHLPVNSRRFNDYGAYIFLQATLWVWSKKGLEESPPGINRANLIYERQAVMELLEYGYILDLLQK